MITAGHIKSLLELQKATNVAYFGEEWRNHWTEVAVVNSVYREWAEFLDEVSSSWKIYGNDQQWYQVNAIYELVDVVHFMLSRLLLSHQAIEIEMRDEYFGVKIPKVNNFNVVTTMFTTFMTAPTCQSLAYFIAYACPYLGIDFETYMLAHKRKNDRNRLRAAGGAGYDKSTETPLTLEF